MLYSKRANETIIFWIFFFFCSQLLAADEVRIKALKVYNNNDETSVPILLIDEANQDRLKIEFDVDYPYEPNLNIVFRFCNRNWLPTDNVFFSNFGQNTSYSLDLERLPSTVEDADYHFRGTYPDRKGEVSFPYSGKWMLFITDSHDSSIVYATARFIVVRDPIKLTGTIKNETLEDKTYFPNDLGKAFNLTVNFQLPDELFPANVTEVEIFENHKFNYPYKVNREGNTRHRYYSWDGNRKFSFSSKEIRPGKEYRQVDIRNINRYAAKDVNAQFDGVEISRFFVQADTDLDGGSVLTRYRDPNAVYMNVTFRLRASLSYGKDVYLVGAFNGWQVRPEYKLTNHEGLYIITIPLKRGLYDYQYVTSADGGTKITDADWYELEGNDWYTSNVYNALVWYSDPDKGGFDRIIGFINLKSK